MWPRCAIIPTNGLTAVERGCLFILRITNAWNYVLTNTVDFSSLPPLWETWLTYRYTLPAVSLSHFSPRYFRVCVLNRLYCSLLGAPCLMTMTMTMTISVSASFCTYLSVRLSVCELVIKWVSERANLFIIDKLGSLTVYPTYNRLHILNWHNPGGS